LIYISQQGKEHTKKEFNSRIEEGKMRAIEEIEKLMTKKGLQAQDLGGHSDYKEKLNKLDKI